MRKLLTSLFVLAGVILGGSLPASAAAATGLIAKPAISSAVQVEKAGWRHHGHRRGIFLGFGGGYGGYPYYRRPYYNNYYSGYPVRHHRRHWCGRHDRWEY
jgi:hypothetical protein